VGDFSEESGEYVGQHSVTAFGQRLDFEGVVHQNADPLAYAATKHYAAPSESVRDAIITALRSEFRFIGGENDAWHRVGVSVFQKFAAVGLAIHPMSEADRRLADTDAQHRQQAEERQQAEDRAKAAHPSREAVPSGTPPNMAQVAESSRLADEVEANSRFVTSEELGGDENREPGGV
jgi:hypothetical protein